MCCLENGLVSKSAQMCVSSLSLCSLELQATMKHLLPHVLQRMGQVAATPTLALPVLEFLSGLIPIPSLYNGFSDREYLSVFAIALPYTDHQKLVKKIRKRHQYFSVTKLYIILLINLISTVVIIGGAKTKNVLSKL